MQLGASIYDPESIREDLRRAEVSESTKWLYVTHYTTFLKFLGGT